MPKGEQREGYELEHPNRDKAGSKATKAIVVLLTIVSVALMLVVAVGGWDVLVGAKPAFIAYILLYLVLAFFIARWNRGALPLLSALAIILTIFAVVSIQPWMDRDKAGYLDSSVPAEVLGLVCVILAIVQLLLIAFALRGFSQQWNVEVERPVDGRRGDAQPA